MKKIKNVFGEGTIYNIDELGEKIYITCSACMSVWTDALSWSSVHPEKLEKNPEQALAIVVLGCQVTDLAVLADLKVAEKLHQKYGKEIYMGGCLAQRFDITLPPYIKRLEVARKENKAIEDFNLVNYEKPFWVNDFEENSDELANGNLFRNAYPLKIGAGCDGNCKYCTIRHTRADKYNVPPEEQISEFAEHENVVLIADNPTPEQIKGWCIIAHMLKKEISIRNIEPLTVVKCEEELVTLASKGLLKIFHCPIQSFDAEVLKLMNRSVQNTFKAIEIMKVLRAKGTLLATNIIIDYEVDGKVYPNWDKERLAAEFDYYSWNPYWNGKWDANEAEKRYTKYLKNGRM